MIGFPASVQRVAVLGDIGGQLGVLRRVLADLGATSADSLTISPSSRSVTLSGLGPPAWTTLAASPWPSIAARPTRAAGCSCSATTTWPFSAVHAARPGRRCPQTTVRRGR